MYTRPYLAFLSPARRAHVRGAERERISGIDGGRRRARGAARRAGYSARAAAGRCGALESIFIILNKNEIHF